MNNSRRQRLMAYAARTEVRAITSAGHSQASRLRHVLIMRAITARLLAADRRDIARVILSNIDKNLERSRM